jgi:diguanylate cyclase (GGDEF)-like protein
MKSMALRRLAAACAVVLAFGVVAGAALYLSRAQADARQSVLGAFDTRARLAAELTGDTLAASDSKTRGYATAAFGGPVSGLGAALKQGLDPSVSWIVVLSGRGLPLAAAPASALAKATALRADPGFEQATRTGRLAFGDLVIENGVAIVNAYQPYAVAGGSRILVLPTRVSDLATLLHGALNVSDSRSYVVDSAGHVLVSTVNASTGSSAPGETAGEYLVSTAVSDSSWRTVVVTSRSALLGPVERTARSGWFVFAGFAGAVVLTFLMGTSTLISSSRLAHARLHDQLTGLPGRSLFLSRAEGALRRGTTATLFLDLDGFKPVNDTFGHAVGDALLRQVAERLRETIRPDDYVSRFGGDEFLVLCPSLQDEQDAFAVADRIRRRLTEPYEIAGHLVWIGVSIGIAAAGPPANNAEALIQNADVALYLAKEAGRGRIERFTPDMVGS